MDSFTNTNNIGKQIHNRLEIDKRFSLSLSLSLSFSLSLSCGFESNSLLCLFSKFLCPPISEASKNDSFRH
uniref:Uncharacterized protein n=1 Tax=Arundo donax TaxID=35708 RepID=A0A0A9EL66_ARUDO